MAQNNPTLITELLYGVHPIIECLRAKRRKITSIYVAKPHPAEWKTIRALLPYSFGAIQYVSRDTLTRMAGTSEHMGFVAWADPFPYEKRQFNKAQHPRVLILDGIQDVRNMGAILRSAYCTGVTAVIIPKHGASPVTAATLKASAGLAEHLSIYVVPKVSNSIKELSDMGYSIYTTVVDGGKDVREVEFRTPLCIVIGSESRGVDLEVRKLGLGVTLPQRDTSSYNASVAAGIFLFLSGFPVNKS